MDATTISDFGQLDRAALTACFLTLFQRAPPPRASLAFLRINCAWELQARQHRAPARDARRRVLKLARRFEADPTHAPFPRPRIKPGTRLVRQWQGRTHTVTTTDDGYEYEGNRYASLSVIARTITGTRWSGPAFFGLPPDRRRHAL